MSIWVIVFVSSDEWLPGSSWPTVLRVAYPRRRHGRNEGQDHLGADKPRPTRVHLLGGSLWFFPSQLQQGRRACREAGAVGVRQKCASTRGSNLCLLGASKDR